MATTKQADLDTAEADLAKADGEVAEAEKPKGYNQQTGEFVF